MIQNAAVRRLAVGADRKESENARGTPHNDNFRPVQHWLRALKQKMPLTNLISKRVINPICPWAWLHKSESIGGWRLYRHELRASRCQRRLWACETGLGWLLAGKGSQPFWQRLPDCRTVHWHHLPQLRCAIHRHQWRGGQCQRRCRRLLCNSESI